MVSDLGLETVDVNGTGNYVGGLVGFKLSNSNITTCYSTGEVTGKSYVGGLVGGNSGRITASYSAVAVTGGNYVGGLVGRARGTITISHSTGSVTGNVTVGGLVGLVDYWGSVATCYSSGEVTGKRYVGGLAGANGNVVDNCYSTGSVSGETDVGGLVGQMNGSNTAEAYDQTIPADYIDLCKALHTYIGTKDVDLGGFLECLATLNS